MEILTTCLNICMIALTVLLVFEVVKYIFKSF